MSNASATNGNAQVSVKKKSQIADTWKRLCRNKTAMLGLVIVILLVLIALLSPVVFDYDTEIIKTDYSNTLQWPSAEHPFGTDELGRDILKRTMYATTISLSIGVVTVIVALTLTGDRFDADLRPRCPRRGINGSRR